MKVRKVFLITVIALSVLFTAGVLSASAGVLGLLDDVWFELEVGFSGKEYNVAAESIRNRELNLIAYLHTTYNGGNNYNSELYTKNAKGVWQRTGTGLMQVDASGPDESFVILGDFGVGQWQKKKKYIQFYQTALIKIEKKGSGAFKSATWKSLGAEVFFGENDSGTKQYYGGAEIIGQSIKAKNLPFGGVLYFSQDGNPDGLYRLDIFSGVATHQGVSGVGGATVGLAYRADRDFLYGSQPFDLLKINRDGSGIVNKGGGVGVEGLTYNPNTKILYAAINGQFFTLKKSDGTKITDLAAPGFDAEGLAVNPKTGEVYAVGDSGLLRKYDPVTDTWSDVGDTGLNWNQGGLAYNSALHMLYACGVNQGNDLYMIDPDTASVTLIGDSGVNLQGGLAFAPLAAPLPPAAATAEIDTTFAEGEISTDQ